MGEFDRVRRQIEEHPPERPRVPDAMAEALNTDPECDLLRLSHGCDHLAKGLEGMGEGEGSRVLELPRGLRKGHQVVDDPHQSQRCGIDQAELALL